jgi:hypothetical protein
VAEEPVSAAVATAAAEARPAPEAAAAPAPPAAAKAPAAPLPVVAAVAAVLRTSVKDASTRPAETQAAEPARAATNAMPHPGNAATSSATAAEPASPSAAAPADPPASQHAELALPDYDEAELPVFGATGVDELSETQRAVLAEEWGYSRVGGGLPEGATPQIFGAALPEQLFGFDAARAFTAVALPLAVMAAGYAWLWYWRALAQPWQQALCALVIGARAGRRALCADPLRRPDGTQPVPGDVTWTTPLRGSLSAPPVALPELVALRGAGTGYAGLFKVAHECANFRFLPQVRTAIAACDAPPHPLPPPPCSPSPHTASTPHARPCPRAPTSRAPPLSNPRLGARHRCRRASPQMPQVQEWLGRLLMLPSLYAFPSWRLQYLNHLVCLNMRGQDLTAWHPVTKTQLALQVLGGEAWRRPLQRLALATPLKLLASVRAAAGMWRM